MGKNIMRLLVSVLYKFYRVVATTFFYLILLCVVAHASDVNELASDSRATKPPSDAYFRTIKHAVFRSPYLELPLYKTSSKKFGKSGKHPNNYLYQAAKRTLTDTSDWLEGANAPKLFNANGICFSGMWVIDQPSRYTGLFTLDTRAPVLVRGSVVLSNTLQRKKRGFGIAVKIFPENSARTFNFFTVHSLSGTKTRHVLDLTLDNEPELKGLPPLSKISTLLRINKDLKAADKASGAKIPRVNYRPVAHLSKHGEKNSFVAPTWLRLVPMTSFRVDKRDFREELDVRAYPKQKIEYSISVASGNVGQKKGVEWQTLGRLMLDDSVTSQGCDFKLHFSHPTLTD